MSVQMPGTGAEYTPPPLSPAQKDVVIDVTSPRGSKIIGGYVDGAEGASFTLEASTAEQDHAIRVFIRDGMPRARAAVFLRIMADELEKLQALEDEIPY